MANVKKEMVEKTINQNTINKITKGLSDGVVMISESSDKKKIIFTMDGKDIEIIVKDKISLLQEFEFINYVVNGCFDDEEGYKPEYYNFVLKKALILYYTNISDNIEINILYDFINMSDIIIQLNSIDKARQIEIMIAAIKSKIEHRKQLSLSRERSLLNLQIEELNKISKVFNDMSEVFNGIDSQELLDYFKIYTQSLLDNGKSNGKLGEIDNSNGINASEVVSNGL